MMSPPKLFKSGFVVNNLITFHENNTFIISEKFRRMNTQIYKTMLEAERDELMSDLNSMGVKDPITGDYNVKPVDDELEADESDIATRDEEFEEDSSLSETFSAQLKDIDLALDKIKNGNYGKCEVCNEIIEEDRLMANPTARTCTVHMNS